MLCNTAKNVYEISGKNLFWSIKTSGKVLDKLKAKDFNATIYLYVIFLLFLLLCLII